MKPQKFYHGAFAFTSLAVPPYNINGANNVSKIMDISKRGNEDGEK